jgi:hypothetical protein
MSSIHNPGRVAGLLYLSLLGAPLRLIYIFNTLFVTGNATATANNIAAHETLFRLGIVSDLLTGTMAIVALFLEGLFLSSRLRARSLERHAGRLGSAGHHGLADATRPPRTARCGAGTVTRPPWKEYSSVLASCGVRNSRPREMLI